VDSVIDALRQRFQLLTDFPQIKEFDINPLCVLYGDQGSLAQEDYIF